MKKYIIFGAGRIGKRYFELAEKEGLEIVAFCDNDETRWGTLYCGKTIISPAMLLEQEYRECEVFVAMLHFQEVCTQLEAMGIAYSNDIRAEILMRRNRFWFETNLKNISWLQREDSAELSVVIDARNGTSDELHKCVASILSNEIGFEPGIVLWESGEDCPEVQGKIVFFIEGESAVNVGALEKMLAVFIKQKCFLGAKEIDDTRHIVQAGYEWNGGEWMARGEDEICLCAQYSYIKEVGCLKGNGIMMSNECWGVFRKKFLDGKCVEQAWIEMQGEARKQGYQMLVQPQALLLSNAKKAREWNQRVIAYLKVASWEWVNQREKVLMLDISVAEYDTNAGHRTTHSYIQLLLEMGKEVVYLLEYVDLASPYVEYYQQQGVYVVYDDMYNAKCEAFLRDEAEEITYAFVNRPQMAHKYVSLLRSYKDMKIVHYGHDLHYLRLLREYDLSGDIRKKEEAMRMQEIELSLVSKVDYTGYPSEVEVEILKKEFPNANIECFPMIYFDDFPEISQKEVSRGILFVGGFGHTPNVDAACWLVEEILPELRKRGITDKLYLVGSRPTEEILKYASNDIVVTGYVTEEELKEIYSSCRLAIAPLRYGAGMKGKVLEAMYNGIPLVTTDIGAEGLSGVEAVIGVGNTVEEIADEVELIVTYNAEELQRKLQDAQNYLKERFGKEKIKNMLLRQMRGE